MKVTEIKVYPVSEEKLKAFVSIVIDRCFMVNDIKVIRGREDLFISMPSRRKKNGKFKDVAHPLNNETRQMIEGLVLDEYRRAIGAQEAAAPPPVEAVDQVPDEGTDEAPAAVESVGVVEEAPAIEVPAAEERGEDSPPTPEPIEEPPGGSDEDKSREEDKSLEEVTEAHLRDSFWST